MKLCAASIRFWCGRKRCTADKRRAGLSCGCSACVSSDAATAGRKRSTTDTGTASRPYAAGCEVSAPSSEKRLVCKSYTCTDVLPNHFN